MGKGFSKGIMISHLPRAAQEDIRRQLGDAAYEKIITRELRKRGRYTVGAKERRTCDGIVFDSVWERDAYQILKERIGLNNFALQPRFLLQEAFTDVDGKRNQDIEYVADFLIGPPRVGNDAPVGPENLVCDTKGHLTSEYRLKRKLFRARYQTQIHELTITADITKIIDLWKSIRKE
jgi:hypothetical protein